MLNETMNGIMVVAVESVQAGTPWWMVMLAIIGLVSLVTTLLNAVFVGGMMLIEKLVQLYALAKYVVTRRMR